MKNLFTIAFMLVCTTLFAQDTLYVMITEKEVIEFDNSTMNIIDRYDHTPEFEIRVEEDQILLLHLYDKKRRFRDVTLKFDDGIIFKDTYNAKAELYWTENEWPSFSVSISEPRRRKGAQVLGTSLAKLAKD